MATVEEQTGSATIAGQLWGARARDWAEFQEGHRRVDFEECIRRTGIGEGTAVLDVGCGAGGFCRLAASAGASVTGIDAAPGMIEIARQRRAGGPVRRRRSPGSAVRRLLVRRRHGFS